jgi:hypothetical protein
MVRNDFGDKKMTLGSAFAAYLSDQSIAAALADELAGQLPGPAALLRMSDAGPTSVDGALLDPCWAGRRCHVGTAPPDDAAAGDLWFDPVEVVGMLLVPRPAEEYASWPAAVRERMTPTVSWLSVSPARTWQVRGWAEASGTAIVLGDAPDQAPVTGLSGWAAGRYTTFFGKALADRFDWTAVYELGPDVARVLWPEDSGPELAGYVGEGEVLVLDREHALVPDDDEDDDDEDDDGDDDFQDDAEPLTGVTFRTHVSSQQGLLPRAQ